MIPIEFLNAKLLLWIPAVIVALAFLIRRDFVRFKDKKEQAEYYKSKKKLRIFIFFSRSIIISLIIIALAVPHTTQQIVVHGEPELTIFVDNSKSFDLFNRDVVNPLKSKIEKEMPVTVRQIAEANRSAIGDALLSYLQGDDNVLLVSDGNNNYGRSLGDMITFAAMLNSTINALRVSPVKKDATITITGPSITTSQAENTFRVNVYTAGILQSFNLKVTVDGSTVINRAVTEGSYEFKERFGEGYHKLIARISLNDEFLENNVYYKTVKVEPKPKVAFITKDASPLGGMFSEIYEIYEFSSLPGNLDPYSAVVLNNIPASEINTNRLTDYIADGNGLFVVGGTDSLDMDSYKQSSYKPFEALLPISIGQGAEEEKKEVNVVIVIDKSGSTGSMFGSGSKNTVEAVEKALAINIIDDLRNDDQVAVVAFDAVPYVVSEFSRLGPKKEQLKNRISHIIYGGGTIVYEGLDQAYDLLRQAHGSKNVILISDGHSGAAYWNDITAAKRIAYHGGRLFTVGVGETTNYKLMQDLAEAGSGVYFEPEETQRIKVIFGKTSPKDLTYNFEILNNYHFITRGLFLEGGVTGLNTVVPKSSAMMLVATENNDPILTVWRFGLGRVAVLSTDDGDQWSGPLLAQRNSLLLARTGNWVIGDLSRKKEFDVSIADVSLGETMDINVKSNELPKWDGLQFSKIGEDIYTSQFYPQSTGYYTFFNADVAVNIEKELQSVGMNPELENLVGLSGGRMFSLGETDEIITKVREDSRRYKTDIVSYAWIAALIALILLLFEISVRRSAENKKVLNK